MDEDSKLLITYLRSRPPRAVVDWASDHVRADTPWASRWVDVRTIDPEAPDMNWTWTIVGPDDPDQADPEQLWCFSLPYDLDVYEVWKPPVPPNIMPSLVCEVPAARGRGLPPERLRTLQDEAARADHGVIVHGGWSAGSITAALHHWAAVHADRDDLRFRWDRNADRSEMLKKVAERAASDGPFRDLGEGLVVHDEVMDELLHDLDSAAEIENLLRGALRRPD